MKTKRTSCAGSDVSILLTGHSLMCSMCVTFVGNVFRFGKFPIFIGVNTNCNSGLCVLYRACIVIQLCNVNQQI